MSKPTSWPEARGLRILGITYGLASNIIGRLVLLALIALPLWKGAHHLRSLSIDFQAFGGLGIEDFVQLEVTVIVYYWMFHVIFFIKRLPKKMKIFKFSSF